MISVGWNPVGGRASVEFAPSVFLSQANDVNIASMNGIHNEFGSAAVLLKLYTQNLY